MYLEGRPRDKPDRTAIMQESPDPPRDTAALERFGTDAVSFQSLESGLAWWHDAPRPEGTGAALAYRDTGRSWIAVGTPLVETAAVACAARRFAEAARAQRRRAVFFGVEQIDAFTGFRRLALGLQSILLPERWPATLGAHRKLREQLRRARAKGVTVRLASAADVAPGTALRGEIERLRREWLAARPMEPMGFLVAVEPFHAAHHHLYVVAERRGRVVQVLSAVPAFASRGWLFEDMLRGPDAPNGTTELVLDLALRTIAGDAAWATPGLTPLAGPIAWWLRAARTVTTPLYDFDGLRRFRARLSPARWIPVWLVWDRGPAWLVLIDVLRAFACGPLTAFAWRSLTRHPNGPAWAVALPLVPWTGLLIGLLSAGAAGTLGYSAPTLAAWVIFDLGLAWLLFQTARRPARRSLGLLALAAAVDATISLHHLAARGLGPDATSAVMRLVATAGPVLGTAALTWAAGIAHRRHRPVTRRS
jgi:phosphatidylglycerol lysyltransferase